MRTSLRLLVLVAAALATTSPLVAQDEPAVQVRFLALKEAREAIADESMEPYFSLMQPLEMVAKTCVPLEAKDLAGQREECRQRYRDATREFTDEEKAAITDAVTEIHDDLKLPYPMFAATPWTFLKIDPTIEGGMPFTHGASIVIPSWLAERMAKFFAAKQRPARSEFGQTLIHEQMHVLQRAHPAMFAELYVDVWGFLHAKGVPSCAWLDRQQMLDPDGVDTGWVFPAKEAKTTTYWQPLVTLAEGKTRPRMPQDFEILGVALDRRGSSFAPRVPKDAKDGKPETRRLDMIESFMAAFGRVPENFHPNETSAVLFSWLAMSEHVARQGPGLRDHSDFDFAKFKAWCRSKFAKR